MLKGSEGVLEVPRIASKASRTRVWAGAKPVHTLKGSMFAGGLLLLSKDFAAVWLTQLEPGEVDRNSVAFL